LPLVSRMHCKLILVAVDFSDECVPAYCEALRLSEQFNLELRVLHVAERRGVTDQARATAWLEQRGLQSNAVVILLGTPWVQIARQAEDLNPVFIVIGSHGTGGYQPLTAGSTTAVLMARSPVPVLVVPSRPAPIAPRQISHIPEL
jgi:nucleotide-binding universal stress UspA family protein